MTRMNHEGQAHVGKRTPYILGGLLIACVIAAVVTPVVLLTRQPTTSTSSASSSSIVSTSGSSNGEIPQVLESDDKVDERLLDSLSYLYSSAPTALLSDEAVLLEDEPSNGTISDNNTSHNNTGTGSGWQGSTSTPAPFTISHSDASLISSPPASIYSPAPTFSPTTPIPTPLPTIVPTPPQVQIATIVSSFNILETIPHDSTAFTQGLTFDPTDSAVVYESTGRYGLSDVRKVDIQTGQVLLETDSPSTIFGEGLAYYPSVAGDYQSAGRLIHITWQDQKGYIFDADTLQVIEEFQFSTARNEGWGITYDPNTDQFLVTDGSEFLHFWDRNRVELRRIPVTLQTSLSSPPELVTQLNEVEWDNSTGTVLANIWQTDKIVRIDPTTGAVTKVYDMSQLFPNRPFSADVLNGIAISPENDLWVTGKLWPTMFRIELVEIVQY